MFNRIGSKIKMLAGVLTAIGITASAVIGIYLAVIGNEFVGILVSALGALVSWLSSFVLYGFGQLVENSDIQRDYLYAAAKNSQIIAQRIQALIEQNRTDPPV